MYPPLFTLAAADPAVTAQLGTNPVRLFPFGEAPEDTPAPYAVWQIISGSPENYLGNVPDLDSYTLQIDVYGDTAQQVREAVRALRDCIEQHAYIVSWRDEGRDTETKDYHIGFDVDWLNPR